MSVDYREIQKNGKEKKKQIQTQGHTMDSKRTQKMTQMTTEYYKKDTKWPETQRNKRDLQRRKTFVAEGNTRQLIEI